MRDIKNELAQRKLDAFFVTNETNVAYLSSFLGHDSMLLITPKRKFFITDSRYYEEARETVKGFQIRLVERSTYATIKSLVSKNRVRRMGFESMNLPYEVGCRLKNLLPNTKLVPIRDLIEGIRSIKDGAEVESIRRSIKLTRKVMDRVIGSIRPGISEKHLSEKCETEFIKNGARPAFEPIVASGTNSAKPHARPTQRTIGKNDFAMIDIGCSLNGYNSDMTRMVFIGRMMKNRFRKIYQIVRAAHDMAIGRIAPGVRAAQIDSAARNHIHNRGFGKYFGHSVGHGVGMSVHEQPNISRTSEAVLRPGMVFTIEPAIYIPKFGGARIEDMVLVTKSGCEILTADVRDIGT